MPQSATPPAAELAFDVERGLTQFAELDRRRLFGAPALAIAELEEWIELRVRLRQHLEGERSEPWDGSERREFARLPTHIRIQFVEPPGQPPKIARDISRGGLFIATGHPLAVGSEVCLELERAGQVIVARGHVAWVHYDDADRQGSGMGIRFEPLEAPQQRELETLIRQLAAEA